MKEEAACTVAIVGGGQAAGAAILKLRQLRFAGHVVLVTEEPVLPYERPPLSKGYLLGRRDTFQPIVAAPEANERFHTGVCVTALDPTRRTLHAGEVEIAYDRLLIATGARARTLDMPSSQLEGVDVLRTVTDAERIAATLVHCRNSMSTLLVVGGSWIGLEVACAARQAGIPILVVERGARVCERTLPPGVAERLRALHEANGVEFRFDCGVARFVGEARVQGAMLSDGTTLDIGGAIVGIGAAPNLELAQACGLETRQGIVVDPQGLSSDPFIHAAGDVAEARCAWSGAWRRDETWSNAQAQGAVVAENIVRALSRPALPAASCRLAPWFWSDQYGVTLQIAGLPSRADEAPSLVVEDEGGFVESYHAQGRLVGAAAIGHARTFRELRRAIDAARAEP